LKVDAVTANLMIAVALAIGTPFFIVFGSLSDRIGRKPIIMAGCALAVVTYFPIFKAITHYANPALEAAATALPVTVVADPKECSFQFVPAELKGQVTFTSSCDIATGFLAGRYVPYENEAAPAGTVAKIRIDSTEIPSFSGGGLSAEEFKAQSAGFTKSLGDAVTAAGYPVKADSAAMNKPMVVLLLTILVIYVTMVYGPIAAALVELFPTRIRYTSMRPSACFSACYSTTEPGSGLSGLTTEPP
jgi:MFS family permease